MHSKEEIKEFLLMPIECTTEADRIFIFKGKIFSSQKYRGLDPDMSDLAIKFYKIIYADQLGGRSLLNGDKLENKQFCGDTMISNYSVKSLKKDEKDKWDTTHRCLANFWMLPMPVGHSSPGMAYEINNKKYGYKDLSDLSKSNPKIRDDMYKYLETLQNNETQKNMKKYYPDYWAAFGEGFQVQHYLGTIYADRPDPIDYNSYRTNIEKRAEIISEDERLREKLSKLLDSIEK